MPATTSTLLPTPLRRVAAGTAAAALALTLAPGVAAAQESDRAEDQVAVRLKVATEPAVEVAVAPRVWPTQLLEDQGVAVDGNDLVEVVRDGRKVADRNKRVRQGDTVKLVDVEKHRKVKRTRVRAGVVEVPTTKLAPGRRKVVRQGKAGIRRVVAVRTLHNGEPVKYRIAERTMVREPRRPPRARRPPALVGPGHRRPQLGRPRPVRVGRQPPRGERGRLLRPLPVQRGHLAERRRVRDAAPRVGGRADLPREDALQVPRPLPVADVRPPPLSSPFRVFATAPRPHQGRELSCVRPSPRRQEQADTVRPMADCVFCGIVSGGVAAEVVLDRDDYVGFLDARPLFKGHVLLVPREHVETLPDLPAVLRDGFLAAAQDLALAVKDALGAQGSFVAMNNTVSQSVPHLHLHVVPRTKGDGLRGFFWPRTKYADGEAAEYAARLRAALDR